MEIFKSYEGLYSRLNLLNPGLIGIEGFSWSGKTYLADQLGADLKAAVIHLDDFCTPRSQPPPYAEGINIDRLAHALHDASTNNPTVVEGICLREVLKACRIFADIHVYIKRVGNNNIWYDGFHLENYESGRINPGDDLEPHLSDFNYHSSYRPHEHADFVFYRVEE